MTVGESSLDPVIRVALARHYRPRSHYAPSSTLTLDAPHVVYTGTEYLVVWQLEGYVQYGSLGVQAARVSTNGTLVSGANLAIAVSGPASIDSHYISGPVLAAGPAYGAVYLVRNAPGRPRSAGRVVLPALDGDETAAALSCQRPQRQADSVQIEPARGWPPPVPANGIRSDSGPARARFRRWGYYL
jgi:hypothetical protein